MFYGYSRTLSPERKRHETCDDPINNLDPTGLYDLGAAAGTVANFSGAGAGAGATIERIVGLFAAVVGCPLGGVEAGAVIGAVAGFIFGLG